MAKRKKYGPSPGREQVMLRALITAVVLAVIMLGGYLIGQRVEDSSKEQEARGDLTGRFEEAEIVTFNGSSYQKNTNLITILLEGVDRDKDAVSTGFRNGGQSDFLLLMILDTKAKTLTPLQIDRDTMAEITILGVLGNVAGTRTSQICLSHGFGDGKAQSGQFAADAVSKLLLGQKIDYFISMNMDGISTLNDLVGGVTVTLEDDFSALDPTMTQGTTLTLMGDQAELFVRSRRSIGVGTNEARQVRQQAYMRQLGSLLDSKIHESESFIGTVYDQLSDYLVTNMKRGRLINVAWSSRNYARSEILQLEGQHMIGADGFMEFHADEDALEELVIRLFYNPVGA